MSVVVFRIRVSISVVIDVGDGAVHILERWLGYLLTGLISIYLLTNKTIAIVKYYTLIGCGIPGFAS